MHVALAFCFVIVLWSTTPLAIKWSGEGPGYLFGAASRMALGLACMLPTLLIMRQKLPFTKKAWLTYITVAGQIYGAMLAVYWGAQFIPSGWISVIFGLTPLMTALMAMIWLDEHRFGWYEILSDVTGFTGLLIMFGSAQAVGPRSVWGIAAVLLAAFIQAATAVGIKRIDARLPAVCQVSGGLLLAVPAYLLTWLLVDGSWPKQLPLPSVISIAYLGIVATTIGFALYYYVLTHLPATQVALITLVTPVLSLALGHLVNHEPLSEKVLLGTLLILGALLLHQFGARFLSSPRKRNKKDSYDS